MSQALFNTLTKEVFGEPKVAAFAEQLVESKSFQEEHPTLYLSHQIKMFLRVVEMSSSGHMKMHASICLFDFIRKNLTMIKSEMDNLLPVIQKKAKMCCDKADDSVVGSELYDVASDLLRLLGSSSNAAPDAPKKSPKPLDVEPQAADKPEIARQLFPETKKGEIYRAVSKYGMKSSVVCLADNGVLLEVRYGDKTGKKLVDYGRRYYPDYESWMAELQHF